MHISHASQLIKCCRIYKNNCLITLHAGNSWNSSLSSNSNQPSTVMSLMALQRLSLIYIMISGRTTGPTLLDNSNPHAVTWRLLIVQHTTTASHGHRHILQFGISNASILNLQPKLISFKKGLLSSKTLDWSSWYRALK